jgi:hypothetical protein
MHPYKLFIKIKVCFSELTLVGHWNMWLKIIFYRNIFLSQYCVPKCLVWIRQFDSKTIFTINTVIGILKISIVLTKYQVASQIFDPIPNLYNVLVTYLDA